MPGASRSCRIALVLLSGTVDAHGDRNDVERDEDLEQGERRRSLDQLHPGKHFNGQVPDDADRIVDADQKIEPQGR